MFKFFLSLLFLAGMLFAAAADELKGKVVKVVDGDTLHINITGGKKKQRLRFQGIDAPEIEQQHGKKSARFLADLLLNKVVTIKTDPKRQYDQYDRMLGKVYINGKDVELIMLSEGMAWHYKYHNKEKQYADAEQSARAAKKGLWKDPNPVQPYEFRKQQKKKQFPKTQKTVKSKTARSKSMSEKYANPDFIINEDSPRTPDRDDLCLAHERALSLWQEEYGRLRNFDENKVAPYTLPALPDTLEEWEKQRAGLLQTFKDCMYGDFPPPPDSMEIKLLAQRDDALNGIALRREYRVYCNMNNGRSFNFDLLLYLPKDTTEPPPCFIHLNMKGNHAYGPDMDIRHTRSPQNGPNRWHATALNQQPRGQDPGRMSYETGIKRGYAMATVCYGEIFPDNLDGFRKSCFTLFYDDLRPDCEIPLNEIKAGRRRNIGAYSAWAWGYCRVADALEKLGLTDPGKIACVGQSRLAVASLLAGVNDERFKLVCCNNSGSGGAQLNRRNFGSMPLVLRICRPNWVCDGLIPYIGREDEMPVDQHQLLALVAPRALYVATSSQDLNGDPRGSFLSIKEASKVWNLYGLKGVECDTMPPENTPVGVMARYHVKTGKHSLTPYDWEQYLKFADELFGMKK